MKKVLGIVVVLAALLGVLALFFPSVPATLFHRAPQPLTLYGNIDNRQLNLAFLISERLATLVPEEGTLVRKGDLLGTLETVRIENDLASTKADLSALIASEAAAKALYEKAQNGSRQEDIAMARSGTLALTAKLKAAELNFHRQTELLKTDSVSKKTQEAAEAEYFFLKAGLGAVSSYLEKLLAGERTEDIATAKARWEEAQAEVEKAKAALAIQEQRLADTNLYAPAEGIIRNRLLEPGELAGPQAPVLTLAVTSPKWIRVYLEEPLLPLVALDAEAQVKVDGAPEPFRGWVGFISPVAEFTPKNIETPGLRTALVYETRVCVEDPENRLKLGAPATVVFPGVVQP